MVEVTLAQRNAETQLMLLWLEHDYAVSKERAAVARALAARE